MKAIASLVLLALFSATASATVNIDMVTVGNPGNAPDTRYRLRTGFGSVDYVYQIGKYEVTAGQYTEFLNAVAKADPNGLYNTDYGRSRWFYGATSSEPVLRPTTATAWPPTGPTGR